MQHVLSISQIYLVQVNKIPAYLVNLLTYCLILLGNHLFYVFDLSFYHSEFIFERNYAAVHKFKRIDLVVGVIVDIQVYLFLLSPLGS